MHRRDAVRMPLVLAVLATFAGTEPAAAQSEEGAPEAAPSDSGEVDLLYERENYFYPGHGRRDPFTSLVGREGLGPRFDDLTLKGVIYSPSGSVALLVDGGGKRYRVRRGDVVGNARVTEISTQRVRFAVEEFGNVRQDVLELKKSTESEGAEE